MAHLPPNDRWCSTALALLAVITFGCGDAPDSEATSDVGTTESDAAMATPDAGAPDVAGSDVASADVETDGSDECPASEVAPTTSLTEVNIDAWLVAPATSEASAALELDEFSPPDDGSEAYGASWQRVEPADDGAVEAQGRRGMIAATVVDSQREMTVVMRADAVNRVWANGKALPGDPYGFGDKRVPLPLQAGENVIAVQYGYRGDARVELFETRDALAFNLEDITAPDLRQGTTTRQPLGVMVMNLSGGIVNEVTARVVESDRFEATEVTYPALPASAITQIGFDLRPKEAWPFKGATFGVKIQIESCDLPATYETTVNLGTVNADEPFARTFRSPVDDSVQYYSVVPPSNFDPTKAYALTLSLHGASVRARGQARAYSARDWTYVVAPTNRRRYGFDWEEWGRLNGLAALEHAQSVFNIDPERVYLTGHSMGGHGTWHLGVLFPGRFAAVAPSAGWSSFYSYSGRERPTGAFARARAASETLVYLPNLARRGAYILHGDADRNVPVSEGRLMRDELQQYTDDVAYHEEPGADHWWDGPVAEGTDCVDWPPLFDFLQAHTLDLLELDFEFRTPGPWVSPTHSYATIVSQVTPMEDSVLGSSVSGATVTLETTNVRALEIDGEALSGAGMTTVIVDGEPYDVSAGTMSVGEDAGKTLGVSGPFNQVFHRPFCFVLPDDERGPYRDYAAFLTSTWSVIGNGHACSVAVDDLTDELRESRNLIYIGVSADDAGLADRPFGWDADSVTVGDNTYASAAMLTVFDDGERLGAAIVAAEGSEHLLYRYSPFGSTAGAPDYLVWDDQGGAAAGFFDSGWQYDSSLGFAR